MSKARINAIVWVGVLLVTAGLWFFGARTRLHLVDPLSFIVLVAVAALLLTVLLWWEMLRDGGDGRNE
ncbi:hypothetical protein EDC65_2714 [Stella humosa]|uniref:Uncharacterized protein n=1 Tax=Stella humosa TaxID=94 RepID=A0A3N1LI04_9PROT|nr:hypothetical protein [Stella humosa]ROP90854.1 hypothetical protein EDC65_2714 [Stella humosa]BBK34797.1 hypothetical protein STHU_54310 [Stella humosa]